MQNFVPGTVSAGESRHVFKHQLLLTMRFTAILLLVVTMGVSARTNAQRVTLSLRNASLDKVFFEIEKQTQFNFVLSDKALQSAKPVTVNVMGVSIDSALKVIFREQPLNYQLKEQTILVNPKGVSIAAIDVLTTPPLDVKGVVKEESGKLAVGVSVQIKGTQKGTITNDRGEFSLNGVPEDAILVFTSINLQTFEIKVTADKTANLAIILKAKISELGDVVITSVNTGYQQIPKERATGSFVLIDSALFNRSYSSNVLDRLEGVTSGLAFNKNLPKVTVNGITRYSGNSSQLTVRGRSTINSNPEPLIVLDNFVYDGDLSTLNPDDIESVTLLKDAGAAAIWGAYSGNGVIVITTKKGKLNQPLRVTLNSWLSTGERPNIKYSPFMSAADYIEMEQFAFSKGVYNSALLTPRTAVSPVVELLAKRRSGLISAADSAAAINTYKLVDSRDDMLRYLYQKPITQHYDISFTGGGNNNKYYLSAGYDNIQSQVIKNANERFTLRAGNSYFLLNQKLEFNASVIFQQSNSFNNGISGNGSTLPYIRLADNNGQALKTYNTSAAKMSYLDTAGQGYLLDWNYRPLDEQNNNNNVTKLTDYHIDLSLRYKIINGLHVEAYYNYNKGASEQQNYQSQDLFSTRDLINQYSSVNFSTGVVTRPIPLGGILDRSISNYESQNIRGLINFNRSFQTIHSLNIVAGSEVKLLNTVAYSNRLYGYNMENTTFRPLDYISVFSKYGGGGAAQIPSGMTAGGTARNFISYFLLSGYNYKNKYSATVSLRKDESNLFGVSSNMKGVPLYSFGLGWDIGKESFYTLKWLPQIKLRVTDGYQGNVNNNVAALTTILYGVNNSYGFPTASVSNYPNDMLRWEKVNQFNIGLDFAFKNDIVSGSVEFFNKNAKDLIASTSMDPTSGTSSLTTNSANMNTKGLDISINTKNVSTEHFTWSSSLLFNYSIDKLTAYYANNPILSVYLANQQINPVVGRPLFSVYSYRWAGLDSLGNPQVYFDGKATQSYTTVGNSKNIDNLRFIGPTYPPIFGSIINKFTYKKLSASFLITCKFGNYFRRPSFSGSSVYSTSGGTGNPDYSLRWKKPGDEKNTNVPSIVFPNISGRDDAYLYSDVLVEKGDFIRLQDLQFSYDFSSHAMSKMGIRSLVIYANASNIAILWRANKYGIDPDFVPGNGTTSLYPNPRSYTLGLKVGF